MRKKVILTGSLLIFLLGILWISFGKKFMLYEKYRYPNEEFFGKKLYAEITHNCSDYELEIGNSVLDKAIKVAEHTGTEKDVGELGDVGALSQYYYYSQEVPSEYETAYQELKFQFITCKVTKDKGHVWVVYTRIMKDKNEKVIAGSWDILSLWEIEKQDGEWYAVKISEAP